MSSIFRPLRAPRRGAAARHGSDRYTGDVVRRKARLYLEALEDRWVPSAPPAPPGFTATTTSFTQSFPVTIPTGPAVVTSQISVTGVGTYLHDVDLTTFITHSFCADLDITLTSPAGTSVTITSDNGSSFDNLFNGTLWDDDADPGNQAPFPGNTFAASNLVTDTLYTNLVPKTTLVPEEPLGAFIGENPNGTWTLTISDDASGDGGTLANWTLGITTLNGTPTVGPTQTFSNTTPAAISATGTQVVTSQILVLGAQSYLQDVNLRTFITHTSATDLDITLKSPAGTVVTITSDNPTTTGIANVFNGTLWNDSADLGNPAPFPANTFAASGLVTDTTYTTGTVKATLTPEEALAAFIGEDPNGTWTLIVSDDLTSNGGSLDSWSLDLRGIGPAGSAPVASTTVGNVTAAGGTTHTFSVRYDDETAINTASVIGNNNAIRVTGPNGYDQLATFVSIDNSSNGTPRTTTYSIPAPGGTFDFGDNGSYTISIVGNQIFDTTSPTPNAVATGVLGTFQVLAPAPNDLAANAIPIALNTAVSSTTVSAANNYTLTTAGTGVFSGTNNTVNTANGGDVVFSFTAPAAGTYSAELTQYNGTTGGDPIVYVTTSLPAGAGPADVTSTTLLASNRRGAGADVGEEVRFTLSAAGTVFIVVDEATAGQGGTFYLEVTQPGLETASNDTPATAQPYAANMAGIAGGINPATDVDFYSLGTPAAGSRVFTMTEGRGSNSSDTFLRVTTDTDTLEADDDSGDLPFGASGFNSVIAGTPTMGAPTYLRVSGFNENTLVEQYRLYAVVQPASGSATTETEGNDTFLTANAATNNYFSGSLSATTDLDFYGTYANAGDLIFVALDTAPNRTTGFNGALQLLDALGNVIVSVNDGEAGVNTTAGTGTLTSLSPTSPAEGIVFRAVTAGNYYVRVSGTATGNYLLSITRNLQLGGGVLAPSVAVATGTRTYTENAAATAVDPALTVTDDGANLTGAMVSIATGYANGTDVLAFTPVGSITGSFNPATGILTLNGTDTVANYQTALRSVTFVANGENPARGIRTITFTVTDTTALTSAAVSRSLDVVAVNDPPVNTVPATFSLIALTSAPLPGVSVADPDLNAGNITVTVSVPVGSGTFAGTGFTSGSGTNSISVTGTLAAVNTALATLVFTAPSTPSLVTATIVTNDNGNTGTGGAQSDSDAITITVADPPPVVTTSGGTTTYTEDDPPAVVDTGLTVTDNLTNLSAATVQISAGFVSGQDVLGFSAAALPPGVAADTSVPGRITFTGVAPLTGYQDLLRSVSYANTSQNPSTAPRTISFTVTDSPSFGSPTASAPAMKTVHIVAVNDAPVNVVPAGTVTVLEDGTVAISGVSVGDVDSTALTTTLSVGFGTITVTPAGGAGVSGNGTGSVTVSGTPAQINATLVGGVNYAPASDVFGPDTLVVLTSDGPLSDSDPVAISITPVNDAPTLDPLANMNVTEDTGPYTVNLTGITSGPANEAGQTISVTATSSDPGLIPDPTVSYTSPSGTGTLTFTLAPTTIGTAVITVRVQDSGGTANGGNDTFLRMFTVQVFPINHPPTLDVIPGRTIDEDAGLQTVNMTGITVGPANEAGQQITITAVSSNPGLIPNPTVNYTSPNNTGSLTFTPVANTFGTAFITVTLQDDGGTSNGGVDTLVRTFTVTVNAVNDAPTLDPFSSFTITEDAPLQTVNMTGITIGQTNEAPQTITITAISSNPGLIPNPAVNYTSPNNTGSLTFTPAANANGSSVIAVTVTDSGGTALGGIDTVVRTFTVTVNAVNDPPTLNLIPDLTLNEDAGLQTVALSGITIGQANEAPQTITITAVSSNPSLIPNPAVNYTSPNATGTLSFTPAANTSGSAVITVTVKDSGGTALGGNDTLVRTFTITVNSVNDAPTLNPITDVSINEDSGPVTVNLSGITASGQPDETGQSLTVTATSSNPGLIPSPLSVSYTSPSSTGTLSFTPVANASGSALITVTVRDSGGTANGGVDTVGRTFTVTVNPVNDPPVVTTTATSLVYAENQGPTAIDPGLTVSDIDGTPLDGATVALTGNFAPTEDRLAFVNQGGITGTYFAATGVLTLTGSASLAAYQAALQSVTYENTSDNPSTATRTVTFTAIDPGPTNNTGSATRTITVTRLNDAPVLTGSGTLTAVNEDSTPAGQSLTAVLSGTTFTDPDSGAALVGVAAVGNTATADQGRWQYSTNAGANWFDIGTVADGPGALALSVNTLVRFLPAANFFGTPPSLLVRALDNTYAGAFSATAGTETRVTIDTTTRGGTTPIAAGTTPINTTVNPLADAPTVTAATTAEDTQSASGLVITRNAVDRTEVTSFRITAITGGTLFKSNGTTVINSGDFITVAEGTAGLKFTPLADRNTPAGDSFSFAVQAALDSAGSGMSPATPVTITVTEVNDAPTAAPDTLSDIAEDSGDRTIPAAALTGNDSTGPANESSQTLTITAVGSVIGGTAQVVGGSVEFSPAADYFGPAGFTYTLQDNGTTAGTADPKTATASVTFAITAVNDAPVITLPVGPVSYTEGDAAVMLDSGATLVDVDSADFNTGTLTVDYAANGTADDRLEIRNQGTAAGQIGVSGSNVTFGGTVIGTSTGGLGTTPLVVTLNTAATPAAVQALISNITYRNVSDAPSSLARTVRFVLSDGDGGTSSPATKLVNVTAVNDGPTNTVPAGSRTTAEDTPLSIAGITVSDLDAPTLSVTFSVASGALSVNTAVAGGVTAAEVSGNGTSSVVLTSGPGKINATLAAADGLSYTPTPQANGPDLLTMTTSDLGNTGTGGVLTDTDTIPISVSEVNDAPTAGADPLTSIAEDSGPRTIPLASLLANDTVGPANESGQSLTVTAVSTAVGGTVQLVGSDAIFTPFADYAGPASFQYTVRDDGTTNGVADPKTATGAVSFTITAVNDAPTVSLPGGPVSYTENAAPVVLDPSAVVTDIDSPDLAGGSLSVGITAGATTDDRLSIVPSAEVTLSGSAVSYLGTPVGTLVGGVGAAPLVVSFNSAATPAAARAILRSVAFSNVSENPSTTSRSLSVTVNDGGGGTSTPATKTVGVVSVNDAPTITPAAGSVSGDEDNPVSLPAVTVADVDVAAGDVTVTLSAASGTLTVLNTSGLVSASGNGSGSVSLTGSLAALDAALAAVGFSPAPDFNGDVVVTIQVSDNGNSGDPAQTDTDTISIHIHPVNDEPTFALAGTSVTVDEDAGPQAVPGFAIGISAGPANEAAQVLSFALTVSGTTGTLSFTAAPAINPLTGTLSFGAAPDSYGSATVAVVLTDNGSGTAPNDNTSVTRTFTIMVSPVNDLPTAADDTATIDQDSGPNAIDVLANDGIAPDAGETLSIVGVTPGTHGSVAITGGGAGLTYAPAAGFVGTDSFSYTIDDGNGGTATATVSVTVLDTAAPTVTSFTDDDADNVVEIGETVGYTITFSEPISASSLTLVDFVNAGTAGVGFSNLVVSGDTATLDVLPISAGTIRLRIAGMVSDPVGHPLAVPVDAAQTITVVPPAPPPDTTPPTVTGVSIVGPAVTDAATVSFAVSFSEEVTGVDPSDFALLASGVSGAVVSGVTGAGTSWMVTVATGTGSGTLGLNVLSDGTIRDAAGNPLAAGASGPAYTIDRPAPPPKPNPKADQNEVGMFAAGSAGGGPVIVYNPDGTPAYVVNPFAGAAAQAGARVVVADLTGDGVPDLAVGTGPGVRARVALFDGSTHQLLRTLLPFEDGFTGGVYVVAADVDGDALADIAVSADVGGGPRVTIFSSARGSVLANFLGIDDKDFRGGTRVSFGDVNGDGLADLAVAAGYQGGPRVALFDGASLRSGSQLRLVNDFFIFEKELRNGAFVTLGDLNGDGFADVIGGGGPSGGPRLLALDGKALLDGLGPVPLANFFADDPALRDGVQVAAKDLDGDPFADLVVAVPTPSGAKVTTYPGATLIPSGEPPAQDKLEPFPDPLTGIFVG